MKIVLATDHAGVEIKDKLYRVLMELRYEVEDCGAFEVNPEDDYPDWIAKAAKKVSEDPENTRGIVFGGSGQGEAIVANKFDNVRCALFYAPATSKDQTATAGPAAPMHLLGGASLPNPNKFDMVKLTREHNGSNMLSIGARFLPPEDIIEAVTIWLKAPNPTAERHLRRIDKITALEKTR